MSVIDTPVPATVMAPTKSLPPFVRVMVLLPALIAYLPPRLRAPGMFAPAIITYSLLFYVVTNFAVWAFSGMYSHDMSGLVQCYAMALPFLKYTVACDLLWAGGLFGAAWLVQRRSANRAAVTA